MNPLVEATGTSPAVNGDAPTSEPLSPPLAAAPADTLRMAAAVHAARRLPRRLSPVPPPPPPRPRRLWGLLASVALLMALSLLVFAVFGL